MTRPPITPYRAELVQSLWVGATGWFCGPKRSCWGPEGNLAVGGCVLIDRSRHCAAQRTQSQQESSWRPAAGQSCPITQ